MQAKFKHGSPVMVQYVAGSDIDAGQVVVTGATPRIAHLAILNTDLGSLAAEGGIYEMTGDGSIAADLVVYWDVSAEKVSADDDSGTNVCFGFTVTACSGDNAKCLVRHAPQAVPAT